jgi:RNA chaperone Hfq
MEVNLLDRMLCTYLESKTPVVLTLQNKVRVSGKVAAFDSYVIVVDGQKREIVYRHAVSSIQEKVQEPHQQRGAGNGKSAAVPAQARPVRTAPARMPARQPKPAVTPVAETQLNSGMKEGLLKWLAERNPAERA